ncbi:MAG: hypothetical protein KC417_07730 [Myxococcales bacterium]|nr:hypothetical protein [Myxococcales bacterium]
MRLRWSSVCLLLFPLLVACSASGNGPAGPMGNWPAADAGVTSGDIPCDVGAFLATNCVQCHADPPIGGATVPLRSYADLSADAGGGLTYAEVAVARMQDTTAPMPPTGVLSATAVAPFVDWVNAGAAMGMCDVGVTDPYGTPTVCTSDSNWTGGNSESPRMRPGHACIDCHTREREGPRFGVAGTLFPTAHEPDDCFGWNGGGAVVEITDANGRLPIAACASAGSGLSP